MPSWSLIEGHRAASIAYAIWWRSQFADAPSNLPLSAGYILTPEIFQCIEATEFPAAKRDSVDGRLEVHAPQPLD